MWMRGREDTLRNRVPVETLLQRNSPPQRTQRTQRLISDYTTNAIAQMRHVEVDD